ncbi:MAG TPA: hypothetical protein VE777_01875 [Gaiellales bacterium]|jgi:hypothetical protein|nr:hypothetical protein [Gaiellales bacterium]
MSSTIAVLAAAALVAVAVLLVAWPFVSPQREPPEERLSDEDRRRLALAEARDAAYQGLRDLEHDLRTGKVTEADYEVERDRLRAEAARALRELDQLT